LVPSIAKRLHMSLPIEAKLGRMYQIALNSKFLEAVTRWSIVLRFNGRPTFEGRITKISRLL